MPSSRLHEPWRSLLRGLDEQLSQPTELHCFGRFVIAEYYGLTRSTGDIDILERKGTDLGTIARLAGKGSPLHKRHRVYVDVVGVATVPEDHESRLTTLSSDDFRHLWVRAFERHDLVLAKLERNSDRDREDVAVLARGPGLDCTHDETIAQDRIQADRLVSRRSWRGPWQAGSLCARSTNPHRRWRSPSRRSGISTGWPDPESPACNR